MQSVALGIYLTETTRNPLWLGLLDRLGVDPGAHRLRRSAAWSPTAGAVSAGSSSNNLVMAVTASALAIAALTHHLSPSLACYLAIAEGLCSLRVVGGVAVAAARPRRPRRGARRGVAVLGAVQSRSDHRAGLRRGRARLRLGGPLLRRSTRRRSSSSLVVFSFVRTAAAREAHVAGSILRRSTAGARRAWAVAGLSQPHRRDWRHRARREPLHRLGAGDGDHCLARATSAWLVTAQGVGAVVGALTLPAVAKRTSRIAVLRGSIVDPRRGALSLYGLAPDLWSVASWPSCVLGGAYVGTLTGLNTSVQLHAPRPNARGSSPSTPSRCRCSIRSAHSCRPTCARAGRRATGHVRRGGRAAARCSRSSRSGPRFWREMGRARSDEPAFAGRLGPCHLPPSIPRPKSSSPSIRPCTTPRDRRGLEQRAPRTFQAWRATPRSRRATGDGPRRRAARERDSRRRRADDQRDGQDLRRRQGRGHEVRDDHALLRRTRRVDAARREPIDQGLAQRRPLRPDRRDLRRDAVELPAVAGHPHGRARRHGGQRRGLQARAQRAGLRASTSRTSSCAPGFPAGVLTDALRRDHDQVPDIIADPRDRRR